MNTPTQEQPNYIMVCAEKPTSEGTQPGVLPWRSFSDALAKRPDLAGKTEMLVDNVWLLPEKGNAQTATEFLQMIQGHGLVCRIYKIHGKPEKWS